MINLPFAQDLLLWRLARGFSQAQLARKSRIPQPNLSAIERGKRDVSLRTLRALATALNIAPGILADGVPPAGATLATHRAALERIAAAVVNPAMPVAPAEREVVELLRLLVPLQQHRAHSGLRAVRLAWLTLRARVPKPVIDSLLQRVREHAARA